MSTSEGNPLRSKRCGLLSVLRAVLDPPSQAPAADTIRIAIEAGIGALTHHLYKPIRDKTQAEALVLSDAADAAARIIAEHMIDALAEALRALGPDAREVILLKGIATSLRHYPAPHLRTMGDIDLLIPATLHDRFADVLRQLGYRQITDHSPEFYQAHHHSAPFHHPIKNIWIELHTSLLPPWSPAKNDSCFALPELRRHAVEVSVQGIYARCLDDATHLIYTCEHWLERFDRERGLIALVDVLMAHQHHGIDWDELLARLRNNRAADAVTTLFTYLEKQRLLVIPGSVRRELLSEARGTNAATRLLLHSLVDRYLVRRRFFGPMMTENNVGLAWAALLDGHSPVYNLARLPLALTFPPHHPKRFHPSLLATRVRSLLRAIR